MSEEPREPKQRPERPAGPRPEGPRGRGLGAPKETVFRCRNCGMKQVLAAPLAADALCPKCQADIHTCTNCAHFDTAKPNECRRPVIDRVASKFKRNQCEEFTANTVQEFGSDRAAATADPRAAFDALFKK